MYNVIVKGFNTKEEAETFIGWYEGSAEQDIDIWLEVRRGVGLIATTGMYTDIRETFPLRWDNNSVELNLKMSYEE